MKIGSTKDISVQRASLLIVGPSGVGKTTLAKTLNPKETLIVSAESGLLCLRGTDIPTIEIKTKEDLDNVCRYLVSPENKFKNCFIDSISEISDIILTDLKNDPVYGNPKSTLQMWGKMAERFTAVIKFMRDLPRMNTIMTCLEGTEMDGLERVSFFQVHGNSAKNALKSWMDCVLVYRVFEDDKKVKHRKLITSMEHSPLAKDRSNILKPFEEPDLTVILNKLLGVENVK